MARGKKTGGRVKGSKPRRVVEIEALIDAAPLGPAQALIAILNNDHKTLGHDKPFRTCWTSAGIEYEEPIIKMEHQLHAAKELMKYRYQQKKALDITAGNPDGKAPGVVISVVDYTRKELT